MLFDLPVRRRLNGVRERDAPVAAVSEQLYEHRLVFRCRYNESAAEITSVNVFDTAAATTSVDIVPSAIFPDSPAVITLHRGLKIHLCRKSDPESKGKIEAGVKYVKHNFLPGRCATRCTWKAASAAWRSAR